MSINTLDRDTLLRQMARMREDIKKLQNTLQGQEVSGVKIKNLNWDKGSGGTLRLGGENDTDGSLEVYDSFGQLKARLNEKGLAFASNATGGATNGSYQYFGASPGSTILPTELTITVNNTTEVFCSWVGTAFLNSSTSQPTFSGNMIVQLNVDGVNQWGRVVRVANEITGGFNSFAYSKLISLAAGDHTLKFVAWCDTANTGQMGLYTSEVAYIDVGAVF